MASKYALEIEFADRNNPENIVYVKTFAPANPLVHANIADVRMFFEQLGFFEKPVKVSKIRLIETTDTELFTLS